jgi:hypothetical protein
MSTCREYVRLVLASWVLIWSADAAFEICLISRRVGPIEAWLQGSRDEQSIRAWRAAAGFPVA